MASEEVGQQEARCNHNVHVHKQPELHVHSEHELILCTYASCDEGQINLR